MPTQIMDAQRTVKNIWMVEKIEAALIQGIHPSEYADDVIKALQEETHKKVSNIYAKVIRYGDMEKSLPEKLKISPVAMIPHKSRFY